MPNKDLLQPLHIITNRLVAQIDYDAICSDYSIFEAKNEGKEGKYTHIGSDFLNGDFKAKSVFYTGSGAKCYLLFKKGETSVEKISKGFDTYVVKELDKTGIAKLPEYVVVNLLLNTLWMNVRGSSSYSNITGKLLRVYEFKEKKGMVITLCMNVDSNMCLFPEVNTYLKTDAKRIANSKQTPFIFDSKNLFRKYTKADETKDKYIRRQFKGSKNNVPYFGYAKREDFESSKLGYTYKLLRDADRILGKYLKLEFYKYSDIDSKFYNLEYEQSINYKNIIDLLTPKGIVLSNTCLEEEYSSKVDTIVGNIKKLTGNAIEMGDFNSDKHNIVLIHNDAYYEDNELPDPHDKNYSNASVQHIAIENRKELLEAELKVVLKELLVKEDLTHNKIQIVDWSSFGFNKPVSFCMRFVKEADDKDKTVSSVIAVMTVNPNGEFTIESYNPEALMCKCSIPTLIRQKISDIFISDGKKSTIEMLVFEDIDDIYIIRRTSEHTLPNVSQIGNLWATYNKANVISTNKVSEELEAFTFENLSPYEQSKLKNFDRDKERLVSAVSPIISTTSEVSAEELWNALLPMNKGIGQVFNYHLLLHQGFCCSPQVKSHIFENEYNMQNFIGIHCFKTPKRFSEVPSYSFFVGIADRNQISGGKISKGCVIRTINKSDGAEPDEEIVRHIINLLQVNFVKLEQSSVLPFTAKYIREAVD